MRIVATEFGRVKQILVADSIEIAETLTGKQCFESTLGNIGFVWNEEHGDFLPDRPYPSWSWDAENVSWVAPKKKPESEVELIWDEDTQDWVDFTLPEPVFEVPLPEAITSEEENA